MTPLVSIVVTCFNQERYLEKSVQSVLNQTFTDLECLIVDDGSTDRTREVAQRLMSQDSRIEYFYKENGGVSSARNFGFQKARGEWIQFLDGDDWIDADKTRFQLSYLNGSSGENTIFYCDYERVFLDRDANIINTQLNTVGDLTSEQLIERLLIPDFLADSPFPLLQQCMLMHRSIFAKKMFDESLKALQDRDFTIDLLMAGVKFVYTPIVGAFYTKHQTNRTNKWSYMKGYYILLYETVHNKHENLLATCPIGVNYLIKESIREKDLASLERIFKIIESPVGLWDDRIKLKNPTWLRWIYFVRLNIPNFILYEKYRGPRSKKVISFFSKIFNVSKV